MNPISELEKVAKSISSFNKKLAQETHIIAQELRKEELVDEIDSAIKNIEDFGDAIADDVDDTIYELENLQDDTTEKIDETLESLSDAAESLEKSASLIEKGCKVVCVTAIQGIYKGRIYFVTEKIEPAFLMIADQEGQEPIGIFKVHRFVKFNEEI